MQSSLVESQQHARHQHRRATEHKTVAILSTISLLIVSGMLFLSLFSPGLRYAINKTPAPLESPQFFNTLAQLTGAHVGNYEDVQVFTNGENYYPAEIEA